MRQFACICDRRRDFESRFRRRWRSRRTRRRATRFLWSSRWSALSSPSRWRRCRRWSSLATATSSTTTRMLRAQVRCTGCARRARWRRWWCSCLLVRLSCRCRLVLFQIALDEARMLLDLIFRNAHLQQILQHSLHSRIRKIDARRIRSTPVRLSGRACTLLRMNLNSSGRDNTLRRLPVRRTVPIATEKPSEPTLPTTTSPSPSNRSRLLRPSKPTLRRPMRKRPASRILMRILLPLIHLLLELLRLLLIRKAQPKAALLALERVEEHAVLEVLEGVEDFLVPDDAAVGLADVHQLDPEGVAHEVVGEDRGALEAGVLPLWAAGEGDVEFGDRDGVDLVGGFGDGALDRLLLVVAEDRRHSEILDSVRGAGQYVEYRRSSTRIYVLVSCSEVSVELAVHCETRRGLGESEASLVKGASEEGSGEA